jgi:Protein kinase domain
MAPEILKLEAYSEKVDVWTVGVLVYELFHNVEPFKGDQPQAILQAILTQPLRFDKRCPTEAKALVKYILNIDKNYRPKVEQILNHPYLKDFDINQTLQKPTQNAAHHQLALNSNAQPGPHGNHSGNASKGQHNHGTLHLNHGNHGGNQGSHSGNHGNQNGNFGGYIANQMYQPSQYGSSQQNRNGGGQSTGSANQHAQGGSTPTHAVKPSYDLFENSRRIQPQGNFQGQNSQPSGPGVAGIVGNTLVSASLRAENFKRPQMYSPIGVRPSNTQNTSHPTSNNIVNQTYQIQSHPSNATNVGSPGIQSVQSRSYATLPTRGPSTITINADPSQRSGPQLALQPTGSHPIPTVSGTPRHNQAYTTPTNRISSLTSINQQGISNTTVSGQNMYSLNNQSKPQVISNVGGALLATAKNNPANQQAFQINNDRRA